MSALETEKLMCPHANNYNYFPLTDNAATFNSSHIMVNWEVQIPMLNFNLSE